MIIRPKVIPPGLEPGTRSLEGCCSIQLSYETSFKWAAKLVKIVRNAK